MRTVLVLLIAVCLVAAAAESSSKVDQGSEAEDVRAVTEAAPTEAGPSGAVGKRADYDYDQTQF